MAKRKRTIDKSKHCLCRCCIEKMLDKDAEQINDEIDFEGYNSLSMHLRSTAPSGVPSAAMPRRMLKKRAGASSMKNSIEQLKPIMGEIDNSIQLIKALPISQNDKKQLNDWLFYAWLMIYDSFEHLREIENEDKYSILFLKMQ